MGGLGSFEEQPLIIGVHRGPKVRAGVEGNYSGTGGITNASWRAVLLPRQPESTSRTCAAMPPKGCTRGTGMGWEQKVTRVAQAGASITIN